MHIAIRGGRTIWRNSFIFQFIGRYFGNLSKNGRYPVFQAPNSDGKNQFLLENITVTVIIQKFDCGITVPFVKTTVIW